MDIYTERKLCSLNVVNHTTEKAVKLIKMFNKHPTKGDEKFELSLHCIKSIGDFI